MPGILKGVLVRWLAWLVLVLASVSLLSAGAESGAVALPGVAETNPLPLETMRAGENQAARLHALELAVAADRNRELETVRGVNRLLLLEAGLAGVLGLGAFLVLALLHWRLVTRLTLQLGPIPPSIAPPAHPHSTPPLASSSGTDLQVLEALAGLERRLSHLEHPVAPGLGAESAAVVEQPPTPTAPEAEPPPGEESVRIRLLLGRGQSLLQLGQAETALACFDEVLALDGANADALVKKGMTLEQLGRLDEAVECYDHAIAVDHSMTLAFIYKAGLLNRMQRFNEALDCYEQALRTQSRRRR